ncbi:tRNA pseudouridine(38-40) synthase TruA [Spongiimicrobium sp. 3-5]|uniref:tRNA pseudouridine(38-40) synthase TruA n=1 Tax=Spongiimicrobium sp. 3-5 TaxID=3332596 RepID=UPI00397EA741
MLSKTLGFILPDESVYKILGSGRTDAKVSALDTAFELFLEGHQISDPTDFLALFNRNLPPDIRVTAIKTVNEDFNVIQHSKLKEYIYLFSFGEKNHPFCAPFLANIIDVLDLEAMMEATNLFVGTHDFKAYTSRVRAQVNNVRTINRCEILKNDLLKANFFPETSYALHVEGTGFMRYQIRMIMGALIQVGQGILGFSDIEASLLPNSNIEMTFVAPGSGLLLNRVDFR